MTTLDPEGRAPSAHGLSRRSLIAGAGAVASTCVTSAALAAEDPHAAHKSGTYTEARRPHAHPTLAAAANACIETGRACLSHCFDTFLHHDTTMAECAFAVEQMLTLCEAFAALVAYGSRHLKALAPVCIAVCEDCSKACRVHEEHQPECKRCADACNALVTQAKQLLV